MSAFTPAAPRRRPKDDRILGPAFILPATIGLVAFYIWPLVRGIYLSFTEYNLLTPETFTGIDNYKRMVRDDTFWNAVRVTLEYVVSISGCRRFSPWPSRSSCRGSPSPPSCARSC